MSLGLIIGAVYVLAVAGCIALALKPRKTYGTFVPLPYRGAVVEPFVVECPEHGHPTHCYTATDLVPPCPECGGKKKLAI